MTDADFMRLAIQAAREGMEKGEAPFGACLVKDGDVIAAVHNRARGNLDQTAHAEVEAIREASRRLGTLDLAGMVLYATCEPCPMCFSACLWARVGRIVYASRIADAEHVGIRQIPIPSGTMKDLSRSAMEIVGDVLRDDSLALFAAWTPPARARGGN